MTDPTEPYDGSIHFWFREGTCVLSGRTYPFKAHIKQGEFTYIGTKKIWLVTPQRGWQLQTIAQQLGLEVTIHRSDEEGSPDTADDTKQPQSNERHILPFQPRAQPQPLTPAELLETAHELIRQLQDLGAKLTASHPNQKENRNA